MAQLRTSLPLLLVLSLALTARAVAASPPALSLAKTIPNPHPEDGDQFGYSVALVGTNIGAGEQARALRIALTGGAIAFVITETIGLVAAIWPEAWLGLFGDDMRIIETGSAYLRVVGPAYGFFGLGLALYFASQGAGRLFWPLLSGFFRLIIAIGGGWILLRLTGSLNWLFAALSLALVVYGVSLVAAIRSGAWFGKDRVHIPQAHK